MGCWLAGRPDVGLCRHADVVTKECVTSKKDSIQGAGGGKKKLFAGGEEPESKLGRRRKKKKTKKRFSRWGEEKIRLTKGLQESATKTLCYKS